jgi:hypothetical protein
MRPAPCASSCGANIRPSRNANWTYLKKHEIAKLFLNTIGEVGQFAPRSAQVDAAPSASRHRFLGTD